MSIINKKSISCFQFVIVIGTQCNAQCVYKYDEEFQFDIEQLKSVCGTNQNNLKSNEHDDQHFINVLEKVGKS